MITWGELSGGDLVIDVDEAVRHLRWTFKDGDLVHLVNLRPKPVGRGGRKTTTVISMGGELGDVCDALETELEKICVAPWSTYYQIAPATRIVEGRGVRPDKTICAGTRVLFADLDVKPGGFTDRDQIEEFVQGLGVKPGCVVETGTGGVHLTWRLGEGVSDRLREEDGLSGRQIGEMWWTYLEAELDRMGMGDVVIDRLIDLDARVLRLAGTVRHPKGGGDGVVGMVTATYLEGEGQGLSYDRFMEVVSGPYEGYVARVKERRGRDEELLDEILEVSGRRGMWSDLVIFSMIDDIADRELEWSEILEGWGWTRLREGGDGSVEWTRPGGDGKSASTDWPESPGVMSLFSTDPSTGLLDLYEAGIPLTKWRVYLRLVHDDDVWAALDELGRRGSV